VRPRALESFVGGRVDVAGTLRWHDAGGAGTRTGGEMVMRFVWVGDT